MIVIHPRDVPSRLRAGSAVIVSGDQLVEQSWQQWVVSAFSTAEAKKVCEFVQGKLSQEPGNGDFQNIAHELVRRYQDFRGLRATLIELDHRARKDEYLMPENKDKFQKWTAAELDPGIFKRHTDFVRFAFDHDKLVFNQIRVCRHGFFQEADEALQLKVQGAWVNFQQVREQFDIKHAPAFREDLLYRKADNEVFSFTDTEQGLGPFHPCLPSTGIMATITQQEYERTRLWAARCGIPQRPSDGSPPILQIVSTFYEGQWFPFLLGPRHVYYRVITPKAEARDGADVFEVGFYSKRNSWRFFASQTGFFRSPDRHSLVPIDKTYVTNIPLNLEEAGKLQAEVLKDVNNWRQFGLKPEFSYWWQNCSCFIHSKINEATKIEIPMEIHINDLFWLHIVPVIAPRIAKVIGVFSQCFRACGRCVSPLIPSCLVTLVNKIKGVIKAFIAVILTFFSKILGAGNGRSVGTGFAYIGSNLGALRGKVNHWFNLDRFVFYLPGVVQEWQKTLESTYTFPKMVKMRIAPLETPSEYLDRIQQAQLAQRHDASGLGAQGSGAEDTPGRE